MPITLTVDMAISFKTGTEFTDSTPITDSKSSYSGGFVEKLVKEVWNASTESRVSKKEAVLLDLQALMHPLRDLLILQFLETRGWSLLQRMSDNHRVLTDNCTPSIRRVRNMK